MQALRRLLVLLLTGLVTYSCGNWGWESIETDNQEQLNVFGLISLDDSLQSFVVVHKTLDTAGPEDLVVGQDTIYYQAWEWYNQDTGLTEHDTTWYDPPWIQTVYESRYLVKDAVVVISDGTDSYTFERADPLASHEQNSNFYSYSDIFQDQAIYLNQDSSFSPQPDHDYALEIVTPGGLQLTGSVHTPPRPEIIEAALPDTLRLRNLFEVSWHYPGDYSASITTGARSNSWGVYLCGMDQSGTIEPGDTTWNSSLQSWCYEDQPDTNVFAELEIRLRILDDNYDKYFLATDSDVKDISNFLIGEGNIGTAYGVTGGFGVFGAVSSDWTRRIVTP